MFTPTAATRWGSTVGTVFGLVSVLDADAALGTLGPTVSGLVADLARNVRAVLRKMAGLAAGPADSVRAVLLDVPGLVTVLACALFRGSLELAGFLVVSVVSASFTPATREILRPMRVHEAVAAHCLAVAGQVALTTDVAPDVFMAVVESVTGLSAIRTGARFNAVVRAASLLVTRSTLDPRAVFGIVWIMQLEAAVLGFAQHKRVVAIAERAVLRGVSRIRALTVHACHYNSSCLHRVEIRPQPSQVRSSSGH